MAPSKLEILTLGVTLAMVAALKEYAQEAQAGTFTDQELSALLSRCGGSMVAALDYLSSLGNERQSLGYSQALAYRKNSSPTLLL